MDVTSFRSPKLFQRKACFALHYYSNYYVNGRLFVFIKDTNANVISAPVPFWNEEVNQGKWHKIKILLEHNSGFNQVSHLFFKVSFQFDLYREKKETEQLF